MGPHLVKLGKPTVAARMELFQLVKLEESAQQLDRFYMCSARNSSVCTLRVLVPLSVAGGREKRGVLSMRS